MPEEPFTMKRLVATHMLALAALGACACQPYAPQDAVTPADVLCSTCQIPTQKVVQSGEQRARRFVAHAVGHPRVRDANLAGQYLIGTDSVFVLVTSGDVRPVGTPPRIRHLSTRLITSVILPRANLHPPVAAESNVDWLVSEDGRWATDTVAVTLPLPSLPIRLYTLTFTLYDDRLVALAELRVPDPLLR